jgi:hypothetical protein
MFQFQAGCLYAYLPGTDAKLGTTGFIAAGRYCPEDIIVKNSQTVAIRGAMGGVQIGLLQGTVQQGGFFQAGHLMPGIAPIDVKVEKFKNLCTMSYDAAINAFQGVDFVNSCLEDNNILPPFLPDNTFTNDGLTDGVTGKPFFLISSNASTDTTIKNTFLTQMEEQDSSMTADYSGGTAGLAITALPKTGGWDWTQATDQFLASREPGQAKTRNAPGLYRFIIALNCSTQTQATGVPIVLNLYGTYKKNNGTVDAPVYVDQDGATSITGPAQWFGPDTGTYYPKTVYWDVLVAATIPLSDFGVTFGTPTSLGTQGVWTASVRVIPYLRNDPLNRPTALGYGFSPSSLTPININMNFRVQVQFSPQQTLPYYGPKVAMTCTREEALEGNIPGVKKSSW